MTERDVSRRPSVLHVITKFVDGAGTDALWTVQGLRDRGWNVTVAAGPLPGLHAQARDLGIRTIVLPDMRETIAPWQDWRTLVTLYRLLRRERFQVIQSHSSKAGVLARLAGRLARVPVIIHRVHGLAFHDLARPVLPSVYVAIERVCAGLCDKLLFVSRVLAEDAVARRVCGWSQVEVIHSGLDLEASIGSRHTTIPAEVKKRIGVAENDAVVATVGRLDAQKNVGDLLVAAVDVLQVHPNTTFLIVGDGDQRLALERLATQLKIREKVVFAGFRDDVASILRCIDVYAVPSLYEGLSRAMAEAQAAEKPVVANDVGGTRELVIDGQTGFLVRARDVRALAERILWLLENPRQRQEMGERGGRLVMQEFRRETMVDKIEACYEQLLREKGGAEPSRDARHTGHHPSSVWSR